MYSYFIKKVRVIIATVTLSFVSTIVFAGPNQLDVIGLIPGVSDLDQVKQLAVGYGDKPNAVLVEIGGYKLPCTVSFINNKLSSFECQVGDMGNFSDDKNIHVQLSNLEKDITLRSGFIEKFGKPDDVIKRSITSDWLGHSYTFMVTAFIWKDERGNIFMLSGSGAQGSFLFPGALILKSSEERNRIAKEAASEKAKIKF